MSNNKNQAAYRQQRSNYNRAHDLIKAGAVSVSAVASISGLSYQLAYRAVQRCRFLGWIDGDDGALKSIADIPKLAMPKREPRITNSSIREVYKQGNWRDKVEPSRLAAFNCPSRGIG